MFITAKLLAFVTQPLAWVAVLLCLSLLPALRARWRKLAHALSWGALAVLLLHGWEPLPDAVLRHLETQYPAPHALDTGHYAGVIVLGGALEPPYVWEGHTQAALNASAERMTAALPLLQAAPQLKLLVTGGEGELLTTGITEAERARRFYERLGYAVFGELPDHPRGFTRSFLQKTL